MKSEHSTRRFSVTVTEEQYRLIERSLDRTARIETGQLDLTLADTCMEAWSSGHPGHTTLEYAEASEAVRSHLSELKRLCWGLEWPQSGILEPMSDQAREYDMSRTMSHYRYTDMMDEDTKDRMSGTNMAFPPHPVSPDAPVIIKEVCDGEPC